MSEERPPFRGAARDGPRDGGVEARRREAPASLPLEPPCPFCEGDRTELMSTFGSHASVSTYWCRACRSPFELMKWR